MSDCCKLIVIPQKITPEYFRNFAITSKSDKLPRNSKSEVIDALTNKGS